MTVKKIETDLEAKKKRILVLVEKKVELNTFLEENKTTFREWLVKNFANHHYGSTNVEICDKITGNDYNYTIEGGLLRLKKLASSKSDGWGCGNRGGMIDMFMSGMNPHSEEEVFYEGGQTPKPKVDELYEKLKNDIIENGEISQTIKKYIHGDNILRKEADDELYKINDEIRALENEVLKTQKEVLIAEFTPEKITKLFTIKTVLENGKQYIFRDWGCGDFVKTITFRKETKNNYYLDFLLIDDEEEFLKIRKTDFLIFNYIKY